MKNLLILLAFIFAIFEAKSQEISFAPATKLGAGKIFNHIAFAKSYGGEEKLIAIQYTAMPHSEKILVYSKDNQGRYMDSPEAYEIESYPYHTSTTGFCVGDVNRDGLDDIVISMGGSRPADSTRVIMFTQNQSGRFEISVERKVWGHIIDVKVGDLDKDGKSDILLSLINNDGFSVLFGENSGNFSLKTYFKEESSRSLGKIIIEEKGSGKNSILKTGGETNSIIIEYRMNSDRSIENPIYRVKPEESGIVSFDLLDFDGNGTKEIFATSEENPAPESEIAGWEKEDTISSSSLSVSDKAWDMKSADFDGNGTDEIIVNHYGESSFTIISRNSAKKFYLSDSRFPTQGVLEIFDVNLDGAPDVITSNRRDGILISLNTTGKIGTPVSELSEKSKMTAYPNPMIDVLNIENADKGGVKIADLSGKILYEGQGGKVDVSFMPAGMYLVQSGEKIERVIKK